MVNNTASGSLNPYPPHRFIVMGIPVIVALSYCFIAFQADLRYSIPALVGASALIVAALAFSLYYGESKNIGWSPRTVIIIAAALRLLFLFRSPELSDDIFRYLWDGLTSAHGGNPYAFAPSAAQPAADGLLAHVNHPHLITIYPPAAQIIFAEGALLGGMLGMKALLVAADVAVCAIILRLLSRMKLPPSRAVIYAWHPLPILEIASSGHIDGAGVFFLMLAFMFLIPAKNAPSLPGSRSWLPPALAGLAFSAAALVKLFPLVLFPLFVFLAGRKGRGAFIAGAAFGAAMLTVPFLPHVFNIFSTLDVYVRNWEFAGFAFQALHLLIPAGAAARWLLAAFFLLITAFVYFSLFRKREGREKDVSPFSLFPAAFQAAYGITLAFLLLTPTLHPWYALYLACFLPFVPGAAGLVMTWAVLLSYRVLINYALLGVWEERDDIPALIWLSTIGAPLLCWLLAEKRAARFIRRITG